MRAVVILNRSIDDPEVDRAIEMTWLCQELHCLPRAGGLLDQDARDVKHMKFVLIAQNEKAKMKQDQASKRR